jgi:hypothetical protein
VKVARSLLAVACSVTIAAGVLIAPSIHARDESLDEILGGFESEPAAATSTPDVDDVLGGFEDDSSEGTEGPNESDELDDVFGGFDDAPSESKTGGLPGQSGTERFWDLTGSISLGASYNLRPHYASVGPDPTAQNGTYFGNLQRLRLRGDLQLDLDLPFDWKGRAQGFVFYDYAFVIHGKSNYTEAVLDEYEFWGEVLDLWVQGSVTSWLDLKLGRQVVNWGRSDTLRVTDVLNSLNNREPGLTDIENLRLPSTMIKADAYWGPWSFTAIVIPEIRFDYDPPPGNDFFPFISFADIPPPLPPLTQELVSEFLAQGGGGSVSIPRSATQRVDQWGSNPEYAGSVTGIFSGWDLSLYVARIYQNRTSSIINLPTFDTQPIFTDSDRVTMIGAGGNYTTGSWLFKAEVAWFDELDFAFLVPIPYDLGEVLRGEALPYAVAFDQLSRFDWMAGIEYYGLTNVTFALEFAHRYYIGYDTLLQYLPNYTYEHNYEVALRISSDLMNERLHLTALGLVLANNTGFMGSTIRLQASYDIRDGLTIEGGLLYFVGSDFVPFDTWQDNDRLFLKLKYSF